MPNEVGVTSKGDGVKRNEEMSLCISKALFFKSVFPPRKKSPERGKYPVKYTSDGWHGTTKIICTALNISTQVIYKVINPPGLRDSKTLYIGAKALQPSANRL